MSQSLQSVTIRNTQGISASFLNYGARMTSVQVPVDGAPVEMLVGYQNPVDYLTDPYYLGAVCGRVCNRISNAQFEQNGQQYKVDNNHGKHCLHGGRGGFSQQFWHLQQQDKQQVTYGLVSPHLDQGFPGQLSVTVSYHLDNNNRLSIEMQARAEQTTPVNLTHHGYFHLGQSSCKELMLAVNSAGFLARDGQGIPSGQLMPLSVLGVDLEGPCRVADLWQIGTFQQIQEEQGLDHCFVLNGSLQESPQAILSAKSTGVELRLYSNQPAMQIYTGKFLTSPFVPYQGICLEAQGYTDAPNQMEFPSIFLKKDQLYRHKTVLEFAT